MGLFTKDEEFEFNLIPSTPEQNEARSYLSTLYKNSINYPELQIAELTPTERQVQGYLSNYLQGFGGDYELAAGYFRDVLGGEYDPYTSRYYEGMRNQLDTQKSQAQAQVRRTAQKAGSARSTPFLGIEQQAGQQYDYQKDKVLGGLELEERQLRAGAAQGLANVRGQELAQLSAVDQLAAKERMIEQMKYQAAYEKMINDLLSQYQYNAQIASMILNEQRYMGVQTGGGMSDLGVLGMMGASMAGGALAGGAGGLTSLPMFDNWPMFM